MDIFNFKCKYCGGELAEVDGLKSVGKCKYCGSKQTLPKLENEKRANLFERANHLRRNNEFDKAEALYEQLLNEDMSDPEAYWSLVLCRYGIEYVEDAHTKERKPTVNRMQMTSILGDEDYKSAIANADEEQKKLYEGEAKAINEIQKGILEIARKEEPFDIFICYKETDENGKRSRDSILAQDLYHELTRDGYKVFFARVTLQGKLGSEYEPYIFSALNSSKVMVVLGTKKEHFEAVWVRNEWSRFLGQIKKGERKVLIPAYRDMDAYDLPVEFSNLQALDMSRLGFLQELVEGVENILKTYKNKKEAQKSEPRETYTPTTKYKKKSSALPIIIIALLLVIGVSAAVIFGGGLLKGATPDRETEGEEQSSQGTDETKKDPLGVIPSQSELPTEYPTEDETKDLNENLPGTGSLEFVLNESVNAYTVTCDGAYRDESLVIPSTYNGKPVKFIGKGAFEKSTAIKSVYIPKSIVFIDENAFAEVNCLERITYGGSLEEWLEVNISHAGNDLLRSEDVDVDFEASSSEIPSDNSDLIFIWAPNGESYLVGGISVFTDASHVVIPEFYKGRYVTGIADYAFSGHSEINMVYIPWTVSVIGKGAFNGCAYINSVYYGATEGDWDLIEIDSEGNAALLSAYVAYESNTDGEWSVIGTVGGTSWDTDLQMTESPDNVWTSDTFFLNSGDEFKVRMDGSWAVSFGEGGLNGGNIVVKEEGEYKIQFVYDPKKMKGDITLIPAP